MNIFRAFLNFEFRRFFKRWLTLTAALLILVLSLAVIQVGVGDYKDQLDRMAQFRETEAFKVTQYTNYTQYGGYGYRTLFLPSPVSILFMDSGVIPDMVSFVDSGERLRIYQPLKGANIFKTRKYGFADFSGILLFLGSMLAAFLGFDALGGVEFLKTITSLTSYRKTYVYLVAVRLFMLVLLFTGVTSCGLALIAFNGIIIPLGLPFLYFVLSMLLLMAFFFSLGAFFGSFKSRLSGGFLLAVCWFVLVLLTPPLVNYYVAYRSKLITPVHQMELEKLKLVMGFEKRAIEKNITYKYGEKLTTPVQNVVLHYYNNEFENIQTLEQNLREQMEEYSNLQYSISVIFPTTNYISSVSEISSRGFVNLFRYYCYTQDSKKAFFKFYMEKLYFSGEPDPKRVEPFIKGGGNIFYAVTTLPGYFIYGILLSLLYTTLLLLRAFNGFTRRLLVTGKSTVIPVKGTFTVMDSGDGRFRDILFSLMAAGRGKVSAGSEHIPDDSYGSFIYVCHPRHLPGEARANNLAVFVVQLMDNCSENKARKRLTGEIRKFANKPVAALDKEVVGKIILEIMAGDSRRLYIVDDAAGHMPIGYAVHLKDRMVDLAGKGATVAYFTQNPVFTAGPSKGDPLIFDTVQWCSLLDRYREVYDIQPRQNPENGE